MRGLTPGRIVHWVGAQGDHLAAIVIHVYEDGSGIEGLVQLAVFPPYQVDPLELMERPTPTSPVSIAAPFDAEGAPRTWHWIEKA